MTRLGHGDPASEAATDAAAGVTAESAADVERLRAELEALRAQRARAVADYQNLQRRWNEERQEQARLTLKALVLNFLPVLDDLTRALEAVGEHREIAAHPWVEGVRLVQQKFRGLLEAGGVREIAAEGEPFDPRLHEAVAHQPGPEGCVVALVRSGYMLDGLVVRPAMVLVGNGEPRPGEPAGEASPGNDHGER